MPSPDIAWRDGIFANLDNASTFTVTVPATVQAGDVVLILCNVVVLATTPATVTASSTGTTPSQITGSPQTSTQTATPGSLTSTIWAFTAGASDAGATITFSDGGINGFWAAALGAWSLAQLPLDASNGTASALNANPASIAAPTLTTTVNGDWAVLFGGGALETGAFSAVPTGNLRVTGHSGSFIGATIVDGGPLAAGTSIGDGQLFAMTGPSTGAPNLLAAFTVALSPAVTSDGVAVATTAIANVIEGVPVRRWLTATGGTGPYSWSIASGSLPAGLTLASNGKLSGTATATGTSPFTVMVTDGASSTATASLSITVVSAPLSPSSSSTAGGVTTWAVTSPVNGGDSETIRVLQPTNPAAGRQHGFLFTLPNNPGSDNTANGDGLDAIQSLGLHNTYNLTVIEPSFSITPWYADNPSNSGCLEESYMLQVVAWAKANLATTGTEECWLIGFSKSGTGGQQLFFHWPDVFAGVASWDAPFMMTGADGSDPNGLVGGGSSAVYGTQDSFAANYELSAANLAKWSAGQNFGTVNRVWIGGWSAFESDVSQYGPVLTTAGVEHTTSQVAAAAHNWETTPDWVAPALAALIPTSSSAQSVFNGAAEGGQLGSNANGTVVSMFVELSEAAPLTGIKFQSTSGCGVLPSGCAIYNADTQALVAENLSPSWSGAAGSGWVKCAFDGSVTLVAGQMYTVAVVGPLGVNNPGAWLPFTQNFAFPVTNGILTAPASYLGKNQGQFADGAAGMMYPLSDAGEYFWSVDVEVTPAGGGAGSPSITTASLPGATTGVAYSATLAATGGTTPYTWSITSGALPAGLTLGSGGVISGTPTAAGTSSFTVKVTDAASGTATKALSIVVTSAFPDLSVTLTGTSGGVSTYSVTSAINNTGSAGAQPMRVLPPTAPNTDQAHAFLYLLPVEPGQGSTFGDPIAVIEGLNAHNQYNLTCIQPGFPIDPWYADNPADASTQQEQFMVELVAWVKANLATTGSERHYLIGFSKSGVGGQALFFRHQDLFAAVASWDLPADQTFSTFGADSTAVYGTQASFDANYALTSGNLTAWKAHGNTGSVDRIWIGAGNLYTSQVADYDALLTSHGIEHMTSTVAADSHNWAPDPQWVPFALAAIIPQGGSPNVSLLTLTPITLTAGAGSPEDLTTALAGSALGSNTGILFPNTGHEVVYVQTDSTSGGTTVTTDIGTTIQGQTVPGIQVTEAASTIEMFGPFPSQFNKQDGTNDIEIDFGTPANVTAVIVVRQPGVA